MEKLPRHPLRTAFGDRGAGTSGVYDPPSKNSRNAEESRQIKEEDRVRPSKSPLQCPPIVPIQNPGWSTGDLLHHSFPLIRWSWLPSRAPIERVQVHNREVQSFAEPL